LFHAGLAKKQFPVATKPELRRDEDVLKPGLDKPDSIGKRQTDHGRKGRINRTTGDTAMIKVLSAIAIAAFVAAALTILPGFAPQVEASVPVPLAKGDRLDIRPLGTNCSEQAWPNFEPSCLRRANAAKAPISQARLVTPERH
jgi:hypothetical protein